MEVDTETGECGTILYMEKEDLLLNRGVQKESSLRAERFYPHIAIRIQSVCVFLELIG